MIDPIEPNIHDEENNNCEIHPMVFNIICVCLVIVIAIIVVMIDVL
jgi:hypothetical protein